MAKIRKLNVSEIEGRSPFNEDSDSIMPSGTVVVYEKNNNGVIEYVLRVHDGVTDGGVAISPGPGPVIFNGSDGIVPSNLNESIAALFNNGSVYITGGESLRFTGVSNVDGNSTPMIRFWNGEGRHSTSTDTTELVELRVGNDAADGSPTEGFFKIRTEKQADPENEKEWKFDSDGVLTLPQGGDIVDSTGASVLGGGSSVDNNIWVETFTTNDQEATIVQIATSVEYDADGNIFALFSHSIPGVPPQETYKSVAKLTPTGAVLWQVRFAANINTDGWGLAYDGGDSVYIAGSTSGPGLDYTLATLTKIDAADGTSVWSKTYDFGANSRSAVVDVDSDLDPIMVGWADTPGEENNRIITTKVDQVDGSVVWSKTLDGQGDDEAYGMAVGPTGEVVTVGYVDQYDEITSYPVTPQTGSGVNALVINRSDLSNDTFTDTWQVAGTGITGTIGVNQINAYTGLTGTVRDGSGATFDVTIGGDGSITNPVAVANGGTNYLPGHKIKIPYTAIGGSDLNSDIILTVTGTTDGVITSVAAGFYGGGAGTPNTYSAITGTNYQTGSGLTFDLFMNSDSTYTEHPVEITAAGTNYVAGDVVRIPGTQLGGTTPENDLIATVNAADGAVTQFFTFSGNAQTTTYRVITEDAGVDFSGTGTWTLNDVSTDANDRMVVIKYAGDGTIAWQKAVQFEVGYDCNGADADIDADGNIYVCGSYNNLVGQAMSLVKFNSLGVKQWSRQVIGNCQDFATSVVVGPDNNLYLSGVTIDNNNQDINWVVAKYSTGGTVVWQRLINNTASWTFAGGTFIGDGGGSNIAVRNGYVALGGGFGILDGGDDPTAAVVQIDSNGTPFSTGDWDFTGASFSGTLDDTASNILVVDAGKTAGTATPAVENFIVGEEASNFLVVTRYSLAGGNDSLVNGDYTLALGDTGIVTLPAGGTITERYITSNPTIQLTPAAPTVASQKLVIKGGSLYTFTDNGIELTYNNNTAIVGDTLTFYVNSPTYADQTLYWWISPEGANISDPGSGTVVLSGSSGSFSFNLDSDDNEFTVRVSPEANNYDPASLGVESGLINPDAPTFDSEHHLHLTTGNLAETSIILGTDNHNVRTTVNGGVEINTYLYPSGGGSGKWTFSENGDLTFPDATVQTTAYTGGGTATGVSRSDDNLIIRLTDPNDDGLELRSILVDGNDANVASTVLGATGFVISTNSNDSQRQWQFGNDGATTLPNSATLESFFNGGPTAPVVNLRLNSPESGGAQVNLVVDNNQVSVDNNGITVSRGNDEWFFGGAGLQFPDASVQTTAYVKTSGEWTVTPGDNTYSFQVPINGVYQLWVRGNVPNGIISYIATAAVTNSNVPVLGTQYAWNYTGAGNPVLFTTLPTQFIGTEGTISTANPSVGTSTNTFVFGIDNNTAEDITVYYGYTKIS